MQKIDIYREIRETNAKHGIWARPVHRVLKFEDGSTVIERGFAVSDGHRRETVQHMYGRNMTAATAWRRCKKWVEGEK